MKMYAECIFPDLLFSSAWTTASLWAASQEGGHLEWEKEAYGTLGNLPAAFWVLNLFKVPGMQTTAVLRFKEVAVRRNNKKSKPQKGSILF